MTCNSDLECPDGMLCQCYDRKVCSGVMVSTHGPLDLRNLCVREEGMGLIEILRHMIEEQSRRDDRP